MGAAMKLTAITIATIKTVFLLMFISFGYEFIFYQSGTVTQLIWVPLLLIHSSILSYKTDL